QNKIKTPWDTLGINNCQKIEECWLPNFDPNIGDENTMKKLGNDYGMDLTPIQLKKLFDRGIESFKITGRENSSSEIIEDINNFLEFYKGNKN
ncbi:hypothetical protein M2T36_27280, partial [Escherichia coli]|uniref:hypothetical protein n=1 Tax=Escherichia coli TaxID=562 RepID=UPI00200F41E8